MPQWTQEHYQWTQASNANVSISGPATIGGIFVSVADTTPTLTVTDAKTGANLISTFTPVSATWYRMPFGAPNGANFVFGGGVVYTVAWNK